MEDKRRTGLLIYEHPGTLRAVGVSQVIEIGPRTVTALVGGEVTTLEIDMTKCCDKINQTWALFYKMPIVAGIYRMHYMSDTSIMMRGSIQVPDLPLNYTASAIMAAAVGSWQDRAFGSAILVKV